MNYKHLRAKYKPKNIKMIFIAESPPASGKYFYDSKGKTTENLFKALIKVLFNKIPKTKEQGLIWFRDAGYLLVDCVYKPVNIYDNTTRDSKIIKNINNLINDLKSLKVKKNTPIILIKSNVYRICKQELVSRGYEILNVKPIPFPSHGNQNKFNHIMIEILKLQKQDEIFDKTFSLLKSIKKSVVAHFNNNSFGIKWPGLNRDDEYNMASFAYYQMKIVKNKNMEIRKKILSLGEYLVLGSYIFTKLGGVDFENTLRPVLYYQFSKLFDGNDGVDVLMKEQKYFNACIKYGKNLAKKNIT